MQQTSFSNKDLNLKIEKLNEDLIILRKEKLDREEKFSKN